MIGTVELVLVLVAAVAIVGWLVCAVRMADRYSKGYADGERYGRERGYNVGLVDGMEKARSAEFARRSAIGKKAAQSRKANAS